MRMLLTSTLLLSICTTTTALTEETKLAAILPLTGNAADQGEWARRGFELAREELQTVKGMKISLIYEDSHGADPGSAVKAYKAIRLDRSVPVVFSYGSGVGMALTPLVNSDRVIQMGIATATPKYTSAGDFTFRNFPSALLETKFLVESLIKREGITKIAVLNIMNDYGVGTAESMSKAFAASGGSISYSDSYPPDETNFKSLLLKVKKSDAQAVYLAAYPTDGALILKQGRQMGLSHQFVGSIAIVGGKQFFDLANDASEGMLVVSSVPNNETKFFKDYNLRYPGEAPAQIIYAARAYDALMVVGQALSTCGKPDTDCLRNQLFSVRNYSGPSGTFSFDSSGDMVSTFQLFRLGQGMVWRTLREIRVVGRNETGVVYEPLDQANDA
jgi:branched-chain amino acid transport system substrate-binding protein